MKRPVILGSEPVLANGAFQPESGATPPISQITEINVGLNSVLFNKLGYQPRPWVAVPVCHL